MKKGVILLGLFMLVLVFSIFVVSAEKLGIEIENEYFPGDTVSFVVTLYDDENNPIEGEVNFEIQDYNAESVHNGIVEGGEVVNYILPLDAGRGHWAVVYKFGEIVQKELFKINELEKAEINIEDSVLVIKNIGNVPYRKSIEISFAGFEEVIIVPLEIGQEKRIQLTAPDGEYEIKVVEVSETEEDSNEFVFEGVALTGNVIGLEGVKYDFWRAYPLVSLFLVSLVIVIIVIFVLRFKK